MSDFTDYPEPLDLREQLARIDSIMASTQKMLREHENITADTQNKQREYREQIVRIDNMIADAQKKKREYEMLPWQVFATLLGGGAAFFAAGAAFVKLIGG
jgi:hypothetical protein